MPFWDAIILGIVQGLTEFIPVSSTGHLILFREWLGINISSGLSFDAVLQLATTLAVILYFWKDIWDLKNNLKMIKVLIIATIPAVILGLLLESKMETVFRDPKLVAVMLIVGAGLMYFAEKFSNKITNKENEVGINKGFIVGVFQSLALIPGMSRSGSTISGGLIMGLSREEATRFSFILSVPILLGTGAKKLLEIMHSNSFDGGMPLLWASVTAFVVGLGAIHFLMNYLKKNTLNAFVVYRIVLAVAIVLLFI